MPQGVSSPREYRFNNIAQQGLLWTPQVMQGVGTTIIGQCMAWFDAADAATLVFNGGNISTWKDKSGRGNDISNASGANQPTYVSGPYARPGILFTAANSCTLFNSISGGVGMTAAILSLSGCTIFVVLTPNSTPTTGRAIVAESRGSSSTPFCIFNTGATNLSAVGVDFRNDATTRSTFETTNAGGLVSGTTVLASQALFTAQEKGYFNNDPTTTASKTTALSGTTTIDRFALGARVTTGGNTNFCDMIIHEVVILRGIRDYYKNICGAYLAWKWGLNQQLWAQDPFKNLPPDIQVGVPRIRYPSFAKAIAAPGGSPLPRLTLLGAG